MLVSIQRNWNSHTLPVRMQDGTAILEHRLAVSYKVKHSHKHVHTNELYWNWALFEAAPSWKQPKCPSSGERILKLVFPQNGKPSRKKAWTPNIWSNMEDSWTHDAKWECIILTPSAIHHTISFMGLCRNGKPTGQKKQIRGSQGWKTGERMTQGAEGSWG